MSLNIEAMKAAGINPLEMVIGMLQHPVEFDTPESKVRVQVRDGWLVLAVKLPEVPT